MVGVGEWFRQELPTGIDLRQRGGWLRIWVIASLAWLIFAVAQVCRVENAPWRIADAVVEEQPLSADQDAKVVATDALRAAEGKCEQGSISSTTQPLPLDPVARAGYEAGAAAAREEASRASDTAAKANALARKLGIPPETVERNLAEVAASGDPYLKAWYGIPDNTAAQVARKPTAWISISCVPVGLRNERWLRAGTIVLLPPLGVPLAIAALALLMIALRLIGARIGSWVLTGFRPRADPQSGKAEAEAEAEADVSVGLSIGNDRSRTDDSKTRAALTHLHQMRKDLGWDVLGASLLEHVIRAGTSHGQSNGWNFLLFAALAVITYFVLKARVTNTVPEGSGSHSRRPWHWTFWPLALLLIALLQLRFFSPVVAEQVGSRNDLAAAVSPSVLPQGMQTEAAKTEKASQFFMKEFDGVSISLPKNWRWMGSNDAASLNTNAEAITESMAMARAQGNNTILVAGNALDDKGISVATMRLSVRSATSTSQAQMLEALKEPQAPIEQEIIDQAEVAAAAMRKQPYVAYYNVTGGGLRRNGNLVCMWTGSEYDIGKGPRVSDLWICPATDRTFKLATSYAKPRANMYAAIVDHAWQSLRLE